MLYWIEFSSKCIAKVVVGLKMIYSKWRKTGLEDQRLCSWCFPRERSLFLYMMPSTRHRPQSSQPLYLSQMLRCWGVSYPEKVLKSSVSEPSSIVSRLHFEITSPRISHRPLSCRIVAPHMKMGGKNDLYEGYVRRFRLMFIRRERVHGVP